MNLQQAQELTIKREALIEKKNELHHIITAARHNINNPYELLVNCTWLDENEKSIAIAGYNHEDEMQDTWFQYVYSLQRLKDELQMELHSLKIPVGLRMEMAAIRNGKNIDKN